MASVQQAKQITLGCLAAFVILTHSAVQIHWSYHRENKDTNDSNSQASNLLADASEVSRLRRSLLKANVIEIRDNQLPLELLEPTGSISPPLSLTTFKTSHSLLLTSSFPSPSSSPNPTEHVTDWSAVPEHLFIRNYYGGNFSLANPGLCAKKENLTLMIMVTTAIDHFEQRNSVRQTWGHFKLREDVQIAFIVGDSLLHRYNESTRVAFQQEIDLYNDFVIANFEDTYRNLTVKTLHMLDWISQYCQNTEYILKTDDDMFLNVPQILKHIDNVKVADRVVPKIYGHLFSGHLPNRDFTHRHSVEFEVYPYTLTYPNFTSGPAYLMSTKVVRPLFEEVLRLPNLPLEDVLTTGFAAMNLGIPRVDLLGFYNEMKNPSEFTACELINIFAGMTDGSAVQMNYLWFNYIMGRTLCTWKSSNSINKFSSR